MIVIIHKVFVVVLQMDRVIFCLFLKTDKDIYEELLQKYFALDWISIGRSSFLHKVFFILFNIFHKLCSKYKLI